MTTSVSFKVLVFSFQIDKVGDSEKCVTGINSHLLKRTHRPNKSVMKTITMIGRIEWASRRSVKEKNPNYKTHGISPWLSLKIRHSILRQVVFAILSIKVESQSKFN